MYQRLELSDEQIISGVDVMYVIIIPEFTVHGQGYLNMRFCSCWY